MTRVILIDDSSICAETLVRLLGRIPHRSFHVTHCATADDGLLALARTPDVLLFLGHDIGADNGLELLREIRSRGDVRPVIVLSGHRQRSLLRDYSDAGADSYVCKDRLDVAELIRCMQRATRRRGGRT